MNKTIILPMISALAIILKSVFHFEVGTEVQDAIANIILGILTVYGVIKNHKENPS